MLEKLTDAPWWQITGLMTGGTPPVYVVLMLLNTLFLVALMIRRSRGLPALRIEAVTYVQGLVITANALLIYQEQIKRVLGWII